MKKDEMKSEIEQLRKEFDEKLWNVAIASHCAVKGLLAYFGCGGVMSEKIITIKKELHPEEGFENLKKETVECLKGANINDGDIIVLSDKIISVSQKRLVPYKMILEKDPKKVSLAERRKEIKKYSSLVSTPVDEIDLICLDTYISEKLGEMASLGSHNPNKTSYEMAREIEEKLGKKVDVVISDTDTGIDVQTPLIDCITIGATPLGATKGLALFECMRAAMAAEFGRGSNKRIPIVIVKIRHRGQNRRGLGEFRGYDGRLSYTKEGKLTYK